MFRGLNVCFSGFRPEELAECTTIVDSAGGIIHKSVTSHTSILVTRHGFSLKRIVAAQLGIPTLSDTRFFSLLDRNTSGGDRPLEKRREDSPQRTGSSVATPKSSVVDSKLQNKPSNPAIVSIMDAVDTWDDLDSLPLLYGYTVSTTQFSKAETDSLARVIEDGFGGRYSASLTEDASMLLVPNGYLAKSQKQDASQMGPQDGSTSSSPVATSQSSAKADGNDVAKKTIVKTNVVVSEKVRFAWLCGIPVVEYKRLLEALKKVDETLRHDTCGANRRRSQVICKDSFERVVGFYSIPPSIGTGAVLETQNQTLNLPCESDTTFSSSSSNALSGRSPTHPTQPCKDHQETAVFLDDDEVSLARISQSQEAFRQRDDEDVRGGRGDFSRGSLRGTERENETKYGGSDVSGVERSGSVSLRSLASRGRRNTRSPRKTRDDDSSSAFLYTAFLEACFASLPVNLHEPPFVVVAFVACSDEELSRGRSMALLCGFQCTPFVNASTDFVIIGNKMLPPASPRPPPSSAQQLSDARSPTSLSSWSLENALDDLAMRARQRGATKGQSGEVPSPAAARETSLKLEHATLQEWLQGSHAFPLEHVVTMAWLEECAKRFTDYLSSCATVSTQLGTSEHRSPYAMLPVRKLPRCEYPHFQGMNTATESDRCSSFQFPFIDSIATPTPAVQPARYIPAGNDASRNEVSTSNSLRGTSDSHSEGDNRSKRERSPSSRSPPVSPGPGQYSPRRVRTTMTLTTTASGKETAENSEASEVPPTHLSTRYQQQMQERHDFRSCFVDTTLRPLTRAHDLSTTTTTTTTATSATTSTATSGELSLSHKPRTMATQKSTAGNVSSGSSCTSQSRSGGGYTDVKRVLEEIPQSSAGLFRDCFFCFEEDMFAPHTFAIARSLIRHGGGHMEVHSLASWKRVEDSMKQPTRGHDDKSASDSQRTVSSLARLFGRKRKTNDSTSPSQAGGGSQSGGPDYSKFYFVCAHAHEMTPQFAMRVKLMQGELHKAVLQQQHQQQHGESNLPAHSQSSAKSISSSHGKQQKHPLRYAHVVTIDYLYRSLSRGELLSRKRPAFGTISLALYPSTPQVLEPTGVAMDGVEPRTTQETEEGEEECSEAGSCYGTQQSHQRLEKLSASTSDLEDGAHSAKHNAVRLMNSTSTPTTTACFMQLEASITAKYANGQLFPYVHYVVDLSSCMQKERGARVLSQLDANSARESTRSEMGDVLLNGATCPRKATELGMVMPFPSLWLSTYRYKKVPCIGVCVGVVVIPSDTRANIRSYEEQQIMSTVKCLVAQLGGTFVGSHIMNDSGAQAAQKNHAEGGGHTLPPATEGSDGNFCFSSSLSSTFFNSVTHVVVLVEDWVKTGKDQRERKDGAWIDEAGVTCSPQTVLCTAPPTTETQPLAANVTTVCAAATKPVEQSPCESDQHSSSNTNVASIINSSMRAIISYRTRRQNDPNQNEDEHDNASIDHRQQGHVDDGSVLLEVVSFEWLTCSASIGYFATEKPFHLSDERLLDLTRVRSRASTALRSKDVEELSTVARAEVEEEQRHETNATAKEDENATQKMLYEYQGPTQQPHADAGNGTQAPPAITNGCAELDEERETGMEAHTALQPRKRTRDSLRASLRSTRTSSLHGASASSRGTNMRISGCASERSSEEKAAQPLDSFIDQPEHATGEELQVNERHVYSRAPNTLGTLHDSHEKQMEDAGSDAPPAVLQLLHTMEHVRDRERERSSRRSSTPPSSNKDGVVASRVTHLLSSITDVSEKERFSTTRPTCSSVSDGEGEGSEVQFVGERQAATGSAAAHRLSFGSAVRVVSPGKANGEPQVERRSDGSPARVSSAQHRLRVHIVGNIPDRERLMSIVLSFSHNAISAVAANTVRDARIEASRQAEASAEKQNHSVTPRNMTVYTEMCPVPCSADADVLITHEINQRESVLAALAAGIFILTPKYLDDCCALKAIILDFQAYEWCEALAPNVQSKRRTNSEQPASKKLPDSTRCLLKQCRLARLRRERSGERAFEGTAFILCRTFSAESEGAGDAGGGGIGLSAFQSFRAIAEAGAGVVCGAMTLNTSKHFEVNRRSAEELASSMTASIHSLLEGKRRKAVSTSFMSRTGSTSGGRKSASSTQDRLRGNISETEWQRRLHDANRLIILLPGSLLTTYVTEAHQSDDTTTFSTEEDGAERSKRRQRKEREKSPDPRRVDDDAVEEQMSDQQQQRSLCEILIQSLQAKHQAIVASQQTMMESYVGSADCDGDACAPPPAHSITVFREEWLSLTLQDRKLASYLSLPLLAPFDNHETGQ